MKLDELYESILEENKIGIFYYSPKTDKLPNDMIQLFGSLAKQQRAVPESVMNQIVRKYPLMWLGDLLEHMGDLIHAFSDAVNFNGTIVRDVDRKLMSASRTLSNLQANLKELAEQNKIEAATRNISERQYMHLIESELEKYVEAHYKLPAYNEVHLLCKRITTTLGSMQFEECKKNVDVLLRYVRDGSLNKRALTITRNNQGRIIEVNRI